MVKAKMPCLITALSELNEPRYMTPGVSDRACKRSGGCPCIGAAQNPVCHKNDKQEITVWGRADLKDVDDANLGLKGSPLYLFLRTRFTRILLSSV